MFRRALSILTFLMFGSLCLTRPAATQASGHQILNLSAIWEFRRVSPNPSASGEPRRSVSGEVPSWDARHQQGIAG